MPGKSLWSMALTSATWHLFLKPSLLSYLTVFTPSFQWIMIIMPGFEFSGPYDLFFTFFFIPESFIVFCIVQLSNNRRRKLNSITRNLYTHLIRQELLCSAIHSQICKRFKTEVRSICTMYIYENFQCKIHTCFSTIVYAIKRLHCLMHCCKGL